MVPARPPLTSLHDVVLEYITVNAYASTARALFNSNQGSLTGSSEFARLPVDGLGQPGPSNGITKNGAGNGNVQGDHGAEEGMDVDDGNVDDEEAEDEFAHKGEIPASRIVIDKDMLQSIERRREILDHILNGFIERAVETLQNHFPDVLRDVPEEPSWSTYHSDSTANCNGGTRLHVSRSLQWDNQASHDTPVFNTSSDPSHVRLNLQIQQFIESFRQLNPGSSTSSPASSISSLANSQMMNGGGGVTLTHALTSAQGLHAEAKKLKPEVRAVYMQEIKDVGALFAYENVEQSPLGGFVKQERRIRLAEQVNRAILESKGTPVESQLEEYTKRTQAIYALLGEHRVDVQPPWTSADGAAKEHVAEFWKYYGERPFSLQDFLDFSW
ncbi:hypothetical protein L198_05087 [Cryptococcus wingfieldii CBS 7118]|uniref:CTLH domain-containing protein n=1 Tax=Cryptococcus wingfieldii CBS 7118 TaxID=1295528 RepID=A0A1E3J024_9TREE|nr:hypothetical protein L198_05087 [Cryptococcus wingfieldii CBS 7118]ODN94233.1 hypothetical protein L198_05087 [Cryptococcus wingfieldii CBS 7118]